MKDEQHRPAPPRLGLEGSLWALVTCALLAAWGIHRLLVLVLPGEGLAGLAVGLLAALLGGLTIGGPARLLRARRRGDR
ncbi:hypothetical protein SAMN05216371_8150 [Streptomyces sp. TLI_053]|nr:hypothetical protein SAMN05216371_8150 [Streptomyces sp. TLI_053]